MEKSNVVQFASRQPKETSQPISDTEMEATVLNFHFDTDSEFEDALDEEMANRVFSEKFEEIIEHLDYTNYDSSDSIWAQVEIKVFYDTYAAKHRIGYAVTATMGKIIDMACDPATRHLFIEIGSNIDS